MKENSIDAFAAEMVQHMPGWRVAEFQEREGGDRIFRTPARERHNTHAGWSALTDGRLFLWVYTPWRDRDAGKVQVSPEYQGDPNRPGSCYTAADAFPRYEGSERVTPPGTITMSRSKGAKACAADVMRRLVPAYRAEFDRLEARVASAMKDRAERAEGIERAATIIGGRVQKPHHDERNVYDWKAVGEVAGVRVEAQGDSRYDGDDYRDGFYRAEFREMTPDQFAAVVGALREPSTLAAEFAAWWEGLPYALRAALVKDAGDRRTSLPGSLAVLASARLAARKGVADGE